MFDSSLGNDGSVIAQSIEKATDPLLLGADWAANLEICDMINATSDGQNSGI